MNLDILHVLTINLNQNNHRRRHFELSYVEIAIEKGQALIFFR